MAFIPPSKYDRSMKVKTSVTLSEELLQAISSETDTENRSALIETAAWEYLTRRRQQRRDRNEAKLIAENADLLNKEARGSLEFQEDL